MYLDGAKPFTKQDVIDTMKSYAVLGASQNTGLTLFYDGLDTKLVYFSILDTRRQVG